MKTVFVFLSAICVVGLIACAGVKKPDIKGAVDDAKDSANKSAEEIQAEAEAAKAEALKTSFAESFPRRQPEGHAGHPWRILSVRAAAAHRASSAGRSSTVMWPRW